MHDGYDILEGQIFNTTQINFLSQIHLLGIVMKSSHQNLHYNTTSENCYQARRLTTTWYIVTGNKIAMIGDLCRNCLLNFF